MASTITFGRISEIRTPADVLELAHLLSLCADPSLPLPGGIVRYDVPTPPVAAVAARLSEVADLLPGYEAARARHVAIDILDGGDRALAGERIIDPALYSQWLTDLDNPIEEDFARARWRQPPAAVPFPDMPSLQPLSPVTVGSGIAGDRGRLEMSVVRLAQRLAPSTGTPDRAWWQTMTVRQITDILTVVADIQATIAAARDQHRNALAVLEHDADPLTRDAAVLSAREADYLDRVLVGLLRGERIGDTPRGAWAAVTDIDAHARWRTARQLDPDGRLSLAGERAAAELAELDRLYGLAATDAVVIDQRSQTYAAAPGLWPQPAAEPSAGAGMNSSQVRAAMRDLLALAQTMRRPGPASLGDLMLLLGQAGELRWHVEYGGDFDPDEAARAGLLLSSIAARESAVVDRSPDSVLDAVTDHREFVEFLQARNASRVSAWADEVAPMTFTGAVFDAVITFSDPIAHAEAAVRADRFAAERAGSAGLYATFSGLDGAVEGELEAFEGLKLFDLTREDSEREPLWRRADFDRELAILDTAPLDQDATRRSVAAVVNTVRHGWHLDAAQAARAEVLLAARASDHTPVPVPPVRAAIFDERRFSDWETRWGDAVLRASDQVGMRAEFEQMLHLLTDSEPTDQTMHEVRQFLAQSAYLDETVLLQLLGSHIRTLTPTPPAAAGSGVSAALDPLTAATATHPSLALTQPADTTAPELAAEVVDNTGVELT